MVERVDFWRALRARLNLFWQVPLIIASAVPLALVIVLLACVEAFDDATAVRFITPTGPDDARDA